DVRTLNEHAVFFGGNAPLVEEHLGLDGDEILYVGDHLFSDVHVSKAVLRWRTALILRELEKEVGELHEFGPSQEKLTAMMAEKEKAETEFYGLRLAAQRGKRKYGPPGAARSSVERRLAELRGRIAELDEQIAPLAVASGKIGGSSWGPLLRAGNDKSLFARQVERYADVYTSRASNFLFQTPFGFLRAPRGSLPHDPL
ncbi:MAG: 5'-nucleotidase domain-containing protein, partial [Gemmatimonadota bacterium]|nr:5'-nucleotidase domain-containing protein [Gemmatimonadota bacterium]